MIIIIIIIYHDNNNDNKRAAAPASTATAVSTCVVGQKVVLEIEIEIEIESTYIIGQSIVLVQPTAPCVTDDAALSAQSVWHASRISNQVVCMKLHVA